MSFQQSLQAFMGSEIAQKAASRLLLSNPEVIVSESALQGEPKVHSSKAERGAKNSSKLDLII
jgi:hypothetical protein